MTDFRVRNDIDVNSIKAVTGKLDSLDLKTARTGIVSESRVSVTTNTATTLTVTGAMIAGGIIVNTNAAATTLTFDTAANLQLALKPQAIGDAYRVQIIKTGLNGITLAVATNLTIVGPLAIATETSRIVTIVFTAVGTTPTVIVY